MRFRLYREYGALNSPPVFDAVEHGLRQQGHDIVNENEDVAVIWSVLWSGRMRANHKDLDYSRSKKLGIELKPYLTKRRGEILIACQHQESLQWQGMPAMKDWVADTIKKIQEHTHRRIVIRYHPRSSFPFKQSGVIIERPARIPNTYDDFDIFYHYHCVINHNSGPAVQAAISGVPVLCDQSSLAADVSIKWSELDQPYVPDRTDWFMKLCHTEWTVEEIRQGIPMARLFS